MVARAADEAARTSGSPRLTDIGIDLHRHRVCRAAHRRHHAALRRDPGAARQPSGPGGGAASGRTSGGGRSRTRLRNTFVVAQIAVSCTLLAAAALFLQSLWRLQSVDPGFNARGVVLSQVSLPPATFDSDAKVVSWYESLLEQVSSAAGVEAAALVSAPPLVGAGDTAVHREGKAPTSDADRRFAQLRYVDGDYFAALEMRVTSGRVFMRADRSGAPPVVVITEGLAGAFFPQTNPVGQRLVIDRGEPTVAEVIGIVSDARLFGQASDAPPTMYMTSRQWPRLATHVVLRMATPSLAGPLLRGTVRSLDRNVAVGRIQSLEQLLHESLSQPRFRTVLAMLFATMALALTLGGLYGSVSWAVAQRTREFGIRSALGARPRQLLTLVLGQGLWIDWPRGPARARGGVHRRAVRSGSAVRDAAVRGARGHGRHNPPGGIGHSGDDRPGVARRPHRPGGDAASRLSAAIGYLLTTCEPARDHGGWRSICGPQKAIYAYRLNEWRGKLTRDVATGREALRGLMGRCSSRQ